MKTQGKGVVTKFFDKRGKEVKEFAVLKIFHFVGARNKRHYMYKWVRKVEGHLVCMHLTNSGVDSWCSLKCMANSEGVMQDVEIVQQYD